MQTSGFCPRDFEIQSSKEISSKKKKRVAQKKSNGV